MSVTRFKRAADAREDAIFEHFEIEEDAVVLSNTLSGADMPVALVLNSAV